MERKAPVNQWKFCTVCKKNLSLPCPKCEDNENGKPCWIVLDNINGYRHSHCAFANIQEQP